MSFDVMSARLLLTLSRPVLIPRFFAMRFGNTIDMDRLLFSTYPFVLILLTRQMEEAGAPSSGTRH